MHLEQHNDADGKAKTFHKHLPPARAPSRPRGPPGSRAEEYLHPCHFKCPLIFCSLQELLQLLAAFQHRMSSNTIDKHLHLRTTPAGLKLKVVRTNMADPESLTNRYAVHRQRQIKVPITQADAHTCSARRLSSMKSVAIWNFCTAFLSGSGGMMMPLLASASRSCSQSKSLKRRMTSLLECLYCGSVVLLRTCSVM